MTEDTKVVLEQFDAALKDVNRASRQLDAELTKLREQAENLRGAVPKRAATA